MKPQHVIALVVVAVLATVVIEELRISKMREEIIRLQAIPTDDPSDIQEIVEATVRLDEPEILDEDVPPAEAEVEIQPESPTPAAAVSGRVVPDDFPEPEDEVVRKLAMSPRADFALDHGLSNREWAYLEELLTLRAAALQETTGKWIAAAPAERPAIIEALTLVEAQSDDALATFFGDDDTLKAFRNDHARHPEREMVMAMSAELDEAGATLELDKEKQLIESLYQARVGTGSIDWNSPAALKAINEGGAADRFEKEWTEQTKALQGLLPKFLSETEVAAVMAARESRRTETEASITSVIETLEGGGE
ncbi:MAG: hypothetical protein AAGI48_16635 [Verrucomicrobiota bacterium]